MKYFVKTVNGYIDCLQVKSFTITGTDGKGDVNIYADAELLATFKTRAEAQKYLDGIIKTIIGATRYQ